MVKNIIIVLREIYDVSASGTFNNNINQNDRMVLTIIFEAEVRKRMSQSKFFVILRLGTQNFKILCSQDNKLTVDSYWNTRKLLLRVLTFPHWTN